MELNLEASDLTSYLKFMVSAKEGMNGLDRTKFKYLGMEDYLLQHGKQFQSIPLTGEELDMVQVASLSHRCEQGQCFYNAQFISYVNPGFTYCEGVAVSVIPTHHAWLTLNGKVVDLTWRLHGDKAPRVILPEYNLGTFESPYQYFGVEIPGGDWLKWWSSHKNVAVPVLDDWKNDWSLFKGVPMDKVVPRIKRKKAR